MSAIVQFFGVFMFIIFLWTVVVVIIVRAIYIGDSRLSRRIMLLERRFERNKDSIIEEVIAIEKDTDRLKDNIGGA